MQQKVFKGKIWTRSNGEDDSALCIGYEPQPFAEVFDEQFSGKKVTVRYWITTTEMDKQQLQEDLIARIAGAVDAKYYNRYSDITGYLWTEAGVQVGGHNLLNELYRETGKFIYMEVDY